jgi:PAS domain S-box-containing protein
MKRHHLARIRNASILTLALLLVVLDYFTVPLFQTPYLYAFPIGLAAWYMGRGWAFFLTIALALIRALFNYQHLDETITVPLILANLAVRFVAYAVLAEFLARHARLHRYWKQRQDLILEHMPVGVGITDGKGTLSSMNPSEKAIWGIAPEGEIPSSGGDYVGRYPGSEERFPAEEWALYRTMKTGEPVLNEVVEIEAFDGERKIILVSSTLIKDELGHVRGAMFINQDITEESRHEREREALLHRLEEALASNKILKGMLPICASCKRIRNDQGYWNGIEEYLRTHSDVLFSHGICPECAMRLYSEYVSDTGKKPPETAESAN